MWETHVVHTKFINRVTTIAFVLFSIKSLDMNKKKQNDEMLLCHLKWKIASIHNHAVWCCWCLLERREWVSEWVCVHRINTAKTKQYRSWLDIIIHTDIDRYTISRSYNRPVIKISCSLNERKTSHTHLHWVLYMSRAHTQIWLHGSHLRMCSVNRLKIIMKSSGNGNSRSGSGFQQQTNK